MGFACDDKHDSLVSCDDVLNVAEAVVVRIAQRLFWPAPKIARLMDTNSITFTVPSCVWWFHGINADRRGAVSGEELE